MLGSAPDLGCGLGGGGSAHRQRAHVNGGGGTAQCLLDHLLQAEGMNGSTIESRRKSSAHRVLEGTH